MPRAYEFIFRKPLIMELEDNDGETVSISFLDYNKFLKDIKKLPEEEYINISIKEWRSRTVSGVFV